MCHPGLRLQGGPEGGQPAPGGSRERSALLLLHRNSIHLTLGGSLLGIGLSPPPPPSYSLLFSAECLIVSVDGRSAVLAPSLPPLGPTHCPLLSLQTHLQAAALRSHSHDNFIKDVLLKGLKKGKKGGQQPPRKPELWKHVLCTHGTTLHRPPSLSWHRTLRVGGSGVDNQNFGPACMQEPVL